jgi:hypothetical protein
VGGMVARGGTDACVLRRAARPGRPQVSAPAHPLTLTVRRRTCTPEPLTCSWQVLVSVRRRDAHVPHGGRADRVQVAERVNADEWMGRPAATRHGAGGAAGGAQAGGAAGAHELPRGQSYARRPGAQVVHILPDGGAMTLCAGFRCCDSPQRPTPGARKRVRSCACTDGMCVRSRENYVGVGYG